MGTVTVTAKRLLHEGVRDSGRRSTVQLPAEFARVQSPDQTTTPLAFLFGKGEVALKLYLTLVMMTRKPPHELFKTRPDHYFAELLGYEELDDADPLPGPGTRRIKRAMKQLSEANWIVRTARPGRRPAITVAHYPESRKPPWITLPLELWSRGWINVMSARAVFVYTCLRLVLAGKTDDHGADITPWDRERMAIKDDTWQRGVQELMALELLRTDTARVVTDRWSTDLRLRKVYYLNNAFLRETDSPTTPVH